MLQSRFIDLNDYAPEDLIFKNIQGATMSISTTGNPTITIKGEHAKTSSYALAAINMSTLGKATQIEGEGMFLVPILGADRIELEVSGTGTIYIKEM